MKIFEFWFSMPRHQVFINPLIFLNKGSLHAKNRRWRVIFDTIFILCRRKSNVFSVFSITRNPLESHFFHQYFHKLCLDYDLRMFGNCVIWCWKNVLLNNTLTPVDPRFFNSTDFHKNASFAAIYVDPRFYMEKFFLGIPWRKSTFDGRVRFDIGKFKKF